MITTEVFVVLLGIFFGFTCHLFKQKILIALIGIVTIVLYYSIHCTVRNPILGTHGPSDWCSFLAPLDLFIIFIPVFLIAGLVGYFLCKLLLKVAGNSKPILIRQIVFGFGIFLYGLLLLSVVEYITIKIENIKFGEKRKIEEQANKKVTDAIRYTPSYIPENFTMTEQFEDTLDPVIFTTYSCRKDIKNVLLIKQYYERDVELPYLGQTEGNSVVTEEVPLRNFMTGLYVARTITTQKQIDKKYSLYFYTDRKYDTKTDFTGNKPKGSIGWAIALEDWCKINNPKAELINIAESLHLDPKKE
jgi:hypothetical protein